MFFSLDEITAMGGAYFFYKQSDEIYKKKYKLNFRFSDLDSDTIFVCRRYRTDVGVQDSYKYLDRAFADGVEGIVFAENIFEKNEYKNILFKLIEKYKEQLKFVLFTKDTVEFFKKMAVYTRNEKILPKTKIVAITGTMGKTSTTGMLYSILKESHTCYRGEEEANMLFPINQKILNYDESYEYLVLECAGGVKGLLRYFSELLRPDYAIVTKIGIENISTFSSIEGIAENKTSLLYSMGKNSIAVLDDDENIHKFAQKYKPQKIYLSDKEYEVINVDRNGSKFKYKNKEYFIPVLGYHQICNAIKAIELTQRMGISEDDIYNGLKNFKQVGDRWIVDKFQNDVELITDCPNPPNYDALMENIKIFFDAYKDQPCKRICLTRIEHLEQYEKEIYSKIAKHLVERNFSEIILIGKEVKQIHDYVKENSNIKITFFEKVNKLDANDPFIKYMIDTLNYPQAFLFKTKRDENGIFYGQIRHIIREKLKDKLV